MPTETPFAAQRKLSFWQITLPPNFDKSRGIILPEYGAAKVICLF